MKTILVIGAGRSATVLIDYLLKTAVSHDWSVLVADANKALADEKVEGHQRGTAHQLDVNDKHTRQELIGKADIVASLLPAHLHHIVAQDCIELRKHLVTASYVNSQMLKLNEAAKNANLIFMGEMGLDPGIDHMSAVQQIDAIRDEGGTLTSFKSYAGGLVADDCEGDNPWRYKFTWNPRNVVLAGQGTAQYFEHGEYKYIPYSRLFKQYELVEVPGSGLFEAYANRDSLLYRNAYRLTDIPTIKRMTLRKKGFCDAWSALVDLGLTDDSYPILDSEHLTYRQLVNAYLSSRTEGQTMRHAVAEFLGVGQSSSVLDKLEWLGLFKDEPIGLKKASPAQILQHLLLQKWTLLEEDRDLIVMQHEFEFMLKNKKHRRTSTMLLEGEDNVHTGMAKLVGLPVGIFVKLIAEGKVKQAGVHIPVSPEVYTPVLKELEGFGVIFKEQEIILE